MLSELDDPTLAWGLALSHYLTRAIFNGISWDLLVHALLDKALSIQLFGHFDTEFEVFADKRFKLLGA